MGIPEPKRASGDKAASGGNKSVKGVVRVTGRIDSLKLRKMDKL